MSDDVSATNLLNEINMNICVRCGAKARYSTCSKRCYQVITGVFDASISSGGTNPSDNIYVVPLPESELINR